MALPSIVAAGLGLAQRTTRSVMPLRFGDALALFYHHSSRSLTVRLTVVAYLAIVTGAAPADRGEVRPRRGGTGAWNQEPHIRSIRRAALVLTGLAAVLHLSADKRDLLPWIGAAFVLYLIAVVITLAVNVPLNDAIKAAGDPASIGDVAAVRRHFDEARWSAWNLIRTLASTAAFSCLIAAAMMHRSAK